MAAAYHINDDEGLITVRAEGDLDTHAIAAIGRAMLDDAGFDTDLPLLMDFRGVRLARQAEALAELRAFVEHEFRVEVDGTVAVVIDDGLDPRLCADLYRLTCMLSRAELFEDYEQALKWIMRRDFAPLSPLLEQQDSADDRRNEAPE